MKRNRFFPSAFLLAIWSAAASSLPHKFRSANTRALLVRLPRWKAGDFCPKMGKKWVVFLKFQLFSRKPTERSAPKHIKRDKNSSNEKWHLAYREWSFVLGRKWRDFRMKKGCQKTCTCLNYGAMLETSNKSGDLFKSLTLEQTDRRVDRHRNHSSPLACVPTVAVVAPLLIGCSFCSCSYCCREMSKQQNWKFAVVCVVVVVWFNTRHTRITKNTANFMLDWIHSESIKFEPFQEIEYFETYF